MGAVKGVFPDTALFLEEGSQEVKDDLFIFGIKIYPSGSTYDKRITVKENANVIIDDVPEEFFNKQNYVALPVHYVPAGTRFKVTADSNTYIALLGTKKKIPAHNGSLYIKHYLMTDKKIETISVPRHQKFHILDILVATLDVPANETAPITNIKNLDAMARLNISIDGKNIFENAVHPFVLSEKNEFFEYYVNDKLVMRSSGIPISRNLLVCIIGEWLEDDIAKEYK